MGTLPDGFGLALDRRLKRFGHGTVLAGGHPGRVVTLTPDGATALDALVSTGAADAATGALAGRLVASGMAHPVRPARPGLGGHGVRGRGGGVEGDGAQVTVVVPVLDRTDALERCLASLGTGQPVVVVDDASRHPDAVAAVCAARGRGWCGGTATVDPVRHATTPSGSSPPNWSPSSTAIARWRPGGSTG